MRRQLAAFGAAISMTVCVGAAIFAIGAAALSNKSGGAPADAVTQSPKIANANLAQQQTQVQQLQSLVAQYQAREQQYQAREQQYRQALGEANAQIQQFQQVLAVLQQRGLITIRSSDGD